MIVVGRIRPRAGTPQHDGLSRIGRMGRTQQVARAVLRDRPAGSRSAQGVQPDRRGHDGDRRRGGLRSIGHGERSCAGGDGRGQNRAHLSRGAGGVDVVQVRVGGGPVHFHRYADAVDRHGQPRSQRRRLRSGRQARSLHDEQRARRDPIVRRAGIDVAVIVLDVIDGGLSQNRKSHCQEQRCTVQHNGAKYINPGCASQRCSPG